jgi:uncharacterized protein
MKLDLSEIVRNVGRRAVSDIDEQGNTEEFGFASEGRITGKLNFSNTGQLLLITGNIHARLVLECSLCLAEFVQTIDSPVEEEFRIEHIGDMIKAVPMEEDDEPEEELIRNNILNVRELVRQNLLLELPMQPLCRADCKGICPICGADRNTEDCTCGEIKPDSPFGILADLLDDDKDET